MDATLVVLRVSEVGVLALLGVVLGHTWRQRRTDGGRALLFVLAALVFAFAFEDLNVVTVTGRGSYFYNPRFALWLDQVPVFIVAAWAVILWSANALAQAAGGSLLAQSARTATLAVLLDIGFDTVAIRYGMWTWRGVALDEAWFGVPAGNFFGWLWVSLAFALLTQALRVMTARALRLARFYAVYQLVLVPLCALALYKAVESATFHVLAALHLTSDIASLLAFWAVFLLFVALSFSGGAEGESAPCLAWAMRGFFHTFSLIGVLLLPLTPLLQRQRPTLLVIAALLIVWETWSYKRERRQTPPPVPRS